MSSATLKSIASVEVILGACLLLGFIAAPFLLAQQQQSPDSSVETSIIASSKMTKDKKLEIANFGAGCFWCVEAVFQELKGVDSVESGYMGGQIDNPTYEQVCTGATGHAEICQIKFDPEVISFKELLEVFWKTHDPTTLNRQGNDTGTQYRSAVFYTSEEQKQLAEKYKKRLDESGAFSNPIVTEISPAAKFYSAGQYHDKYFTRNPYAGYCQVVIQPKVAKFRKAFSDKLKTSPAK